MVSYALHSPERASGTSQYPFTFILHIIHIANWKQIIAKKRKRILLELSVVRQLKQQEVTIIEDTDKSKWQENNSPTLYQYGTILCRVKQK